MDHAPQDRRSAQLNLSRQIIEQLTQLRQSVDRDTHSLQIGANRFPDAQAIFNELFDAVQSTLQNVDESSADGSG